MPSEKNGSLSALAQELNQGESLNAADLENFKALQKQNKLESTLLEILRTKEFTAREYSILKIGKSNAEYHYLGSGKILANIGKSFADAMPLNSGK